MSGRPAQPYGNFIDDKILYPAMDMFTPLVPTSLLPTHGRVLFDTLQGNRSPITNKDFDKEELSALNRVVQSREKMRENGVPNTANPVYKEVNGVLTAANGLDTDVSYKDYTREIKDIRSKGGDPDAVKRVALTLGNAKYKRDSNGVTISDDYDFHRSPPLGKSLMSGNFRDVLESYAAKKLNGAKRPVSLNLDG